MTNQEKLSKLLVGSLRVRVHKLKKPMLNIVGVLTNPAREEYWVHSVPGPDFCVFYLEEVKSVNLAKKSTEMSEILLA